MSCSNPLIAVRYQVPDLDIPGRRKDKIRIFPRNSSGDYARQFIGRYGYELLYLPCGHCEACKMAYRKDWAVRCEMESMLHKDSCFVTLTFSDSFLKPMPVKDDIQYFLHKLRDSYGIKCRYFACGEIGSKGRAHYHLILFGYKPDDLKYYGESKSGFPMYSSKFLDKVWSKGRVMVNDFNTACASYVAGYVKKDKNQCFIMESTRPGLGHDYMKSNLHKLFTYGHYQGKNGQVHRLPRYFEKLCDKYGYDMIHVKMDKQGVMEEITKAEKFARGIFQDVELFAVKGLVMKDKLKKLKRSL